MLDQYSSPHYTGANLEKEVLQRFRNSVATLVPECKIFREPWDSYTVLCLDFQDCPQELPVIQAQINRLIAVVEKLALSKAIVFKKGKKVIGWINIK